MPGTTRSHSVLSRLKPWLLGACLAAVLPSYGCSDSASDDENLDASPNPNANSGDLGGDDAKEGNGTEAGIDKDEGKGSKNSADINSAVAGADGGAGADALLGDAGGDPGAAAGADPGAAAANGAAPANTALDAPPLNAAAPANAMAAATPTNNAAPANAAAGKTPGVTTTAAGAAPAAESAPPPPAGATTPVTGARVRYVKEGGAQAVNAPNGTPVASLEQGEHPLTWEENGWLRITSGMYVPTDSMSNSGVVRAVTGGGWDK